MPKRTFRFRPAVGTNIDVTIDGPPKGDIDSMITVTIGDMQAGGSALIGDETADDWVEHLLALGAEELPG